MGMVSHVLLRKREAILLALDVIEKMYERVQKDKVIGDRDIEEIIKFLKVFADKYHHGKEKDFLFPALEKVGVTIQNGPIGVMHVQHEKGRELIKQILESIAIKIINKQKFISAAKSYASILRNHIEK